MLLVLGRRRGVVERVAKIERAVRVDTIGLLVK